jgi:hypothetical protein
MAAQATRVSLPPRFPIEQRPAFVFHDTQRREFLYLILETGHHFGGGDTVQSGEGAHFLDAAQFFTGP